MTSSWNMNGTCFFLITHFQWLPREYLRQYDRPIPLLLCSHKHIYTHYVLISLTGDHLSKLAMYIHVFRPLLMLFPSTWKLLFYLFFFSKILIIFQNLASMYFLQGKLSWYAQDCFFFTIIAQCLLQIGFTLFCFIGYFSTYLSVNTWKAGIIPYLYSFPLKKDWGY